MNITPISIYRTDTGEVISSGGISFDPDPDVRKFQVESALSAHGSGYSLVEQYADPDKHYVITLGGADVIAERPPVPYIIDRTTLTAGTGDYVTITGLHSPCEMAIDDPDPTTETTVLTVEGGGFEFEAAVPGTYTIEISRFPFLPATIEITAT